LTAASVPERSLASFPAFIRDIDATLSVHSHFVLSGNVRDRYFVTRDHGPMVPLDLVDLLWLLLRRAGYQHLVLFDPVDRVQVIAVDDAGRSELADALGDAAPPRDRTPLDHLHAVLARVETEGHRRIPVVVDYASRLVLDPDHLEPAELDFFRFCEKHSHRARPRPTGESARPSLMTPVFWVLDRDRDLPAWFTADNEAIRLVPIPRPTVSERRHAARAIAATIPRLAERPASDQERFAERFAGSADGLTLRSMLDVIDLANDRAIDMQDIDDAVRAYRVGMVDNPWRDPLLFDQIADGDEHLSRRVIGQDVAITAALDVLKRSVLGLSSGRAGAARPRGVLFFAGPTGVGKTELAKSLAELVFGDANAYLRFDMSEFSQEHTDARLIGAPPGYSGFEAGGELTNGVRQQPFRLVLFDEIEKAHPRILDKFLQILDDGRLTDGRGSTVYFTEAIIVFTSNLGMYVPDETHPGRWVANPQVEAGMPYHELQARLRESIADYFTRFLNRPELLNRIGLENLVVFDFVGPTAARSIFDLQVQQLLEGVRHEHGIEIDVAPIIDVLRDRCTRDLALGGRGIGNNVQAQLINPLSRALFALDDRPPRIGVKTLADEGEPPEVQLG
jgi:ATP-dependent Clp protease ATP-binding subunit ClpB